MNERRKKYAAVALAALAFCAFLFFHTLALPFGYMATGIGGNTEEQCRPSPQIVQADYEKGDSSDPNRSIAKIALETAEARNASDRVILALFQTGLVESGFRNLANDGKYGPEDQTGTPSTPEQVAQAGRSMKLPHDGTGTDHTSMGYLQQQIWWGTPQELMDPATATELFLDVALEIEAATPGSSGTLAQAVQRSAPNAYDSMEDQARELLDETRGAPAGEDEHSHGDQQHDHTAQRAGNAGCSDTDGEQPAPEHWDGDLGDGEWTNPLPGGVATSPYGRRNISSVIDSWVNDHQGVDLATPGAGTAPGGTVIAPTDMKITFAEDDVHSFGGKVLGRENGDDPDFIFGFYHLEKVSVQEGQEVKRGDVIGIEGNKGEFRMATHLHFEIFKPGSGDTPLPYEGKNLDPEPILREKGAWPE
jgi:murein DD-endopeptidase MepM/ murein hydrolase activator NlpD